MEKMLRKLMDYQKMEQDPRLAKMIRGTESRFASMLSDDDLTFVNAAGAADQRARYDEMLSLCLDLNFSSTQPAQPSRHQRADKQNRQCR